LNKWLVAIVFSILLLVPTGSQLAFAGIISDIPCTSDARCQDGNECTINFCRLGPLGLVGFCRTDRLTLNGEDCDRGDICSSNDKCFLGACQPGDVHLPDDTPCGSAVEFPSITACSEQDTCLEGLCNSNNKPFGTFCQPPFPNQECFVGRCGLVGLCAITGVKPVGTLCGDLTENPCSSEDTCGALGVCRPNNKLPGTICTSDCATNTVCSAPSGLVDSTFCRPTFLSDIFSGPCGDPTSRVCDGPDFCSSAGVCNVNFTIPGNTPNGKCTEEGTFECITSICSGGECIKDDIGVAQPGEFCGDEGNECTNQDVCNTFGNCVDKGFKPAGTTCDDGELCTIGELCTDGECGMGSVNPILACMPDGGDGQSVGGKIIPIEATSLILAGTQSTFSWLIPVTVSAIGIAIVIARKFSKYQPE